MEGGKNLFLYRKEHPVKNPNPGGSPCGGAEHTAKAGRHGLMPAPSGNVVPFMADIRIWDIIWFQADIYHYLTNQLTIIPGQWQMLQILTRGL